MASTTALNVGQCTACYRARRSSSGLRSRQLLSTMLACCLQERRHIFRREKALRELQLLAKKAETAQSESHCSGFFA